MTVDDAALDVIFRNARTVRRWTGRPVAEATLRAVYDLLKLGPTSGNCSPARIVFVSSKAGKALLRPCLIPSNVEKTMTAPVTAVIGHDLEFYENLPRLYPFEDARSWFVGNPPLIEATAFRNGSLQGAYLIIACRSLGLDCGPMSGFDNAKVDQAFFAGTNIRSNFLCNIGYGDRTGLAPRAPRLDFEEACRFA
jgi:3-hydroxypropanoate dehydrogenase